MALNIQTVSKETRASKELSKESFHPGAVIRTQASVTERVQFAERENARSKLKEYFNNIPNAKIYGNTWDVKHLDKFINSSKWGLNPAVMRSTQGSFDHRSTSLPHTKRSKSLSKNDNVSGRGNSRATEKSSTINPGESFCFKNSKRFGPEQTAVYDFSYRVPENNINQAATNQPVQLNTMQNHYFRLLTRTPAPFETDDIEFSIKREESPVPQVRREQLEANVKNQRSFQEWKEKNKLITKRNRIYHSAFKSGIVSLDNPLHESTLIYRDEHDKLRNYNTENGKIQERHRRDLARFNQTNSEISFLNKHSKEIDESPERMKQFAEKPIVNGARRARVPTEYANRVHETQDRVFGVEVKPYKVSRAEFLRSQDLRGKRFNVVTNGVNDIPIRQDIPRRSLSVFDHPLGKSILEKALY